MTSRRVALLAVLAAPHVAACGSGVHDLGISAVPLVTLHGHVDTSQLDRANPSAALLGVLVWAGVPVVNPFCLRIADQSLVPDDPARAQDLADACPDPYGVFPGEAEAWSAIDGDGNFDLDLNELPLVRVTVGDASTRIAYGALVIVEDVNGNGQPPFARTPTRGGTRRAPEIQSSNADQIVAATFSNLHAGQQRVVFREGGFVSPSFYYPAPDPDGSCKPPPGFSIMTVPPYTDPPTGTCAFAATDVRVEVPPLARSEQTALLCRALGGNGFVRQPSPDGDERPDPGATQICFGSKLLATIHRGPTCPVLQSFALTGCQQDPLCATPEWTITPSSLGWTWPCP